MSNVSIIAIHTPTRGVTFFLFSSLVNIVISIHTPTRGVTNAVGMINNAIGDFNPHSHKGSDSYQSVPETEN